MKTLINKLKSLFFRLLFSLCLVSVLSLRAAEDDHDEEEEDEHGGPIRLAERDLKDFGIEVAVAGPGMIHEEIRVPGKIRTNENTMAHVSPRFEGMVKKIHHRLGEKVKVGDVLAEVESHETFQTFALKAPIAGTIVGFHITLGENVGPENYAYVIADTSTVWADFGVYQRDLHKVAPEQQVTLSTTHDHSAIKGVIAYVGPTVDEATRTGLARVVLDNPSGHLRPGSFIVGEISLNETKGAVVVPRSALHTLEDQTVVFVEVEEEGGGFEPRPVQIGRSDSQYVEIMKGLNAGSRYVSKGGFFLKADSQKEDFGDGHAH